MPLSAMLAAALAMNEAFLHVSGEMAAAGRRSVGLDLWNLERSEDWLEPNGTAPALRYLPTRLWLVGLGHLGQAYLWALGLLPFSVDAKVQLVLQDNDKITGSTESTSVLSDRTMIGSKKTRAMAAWADRRGFETTITERLFDQQCRRRHDEPAIALCGMDNAQGRRALIKWDLTSLSKPDLGEAIRIFAVCWSIPCQANFLHPNCGRRPKASRRKRWKPWPIAACWPMDPWIGAELPSWLARRWERHLLAR